MTHDTSIFHVVFKYKENLFSKVLITISLETSALNFKILNLRLFKLKKFIV